MVLELSRNELPFEKSFENIRNCRVLKRQDEPQRCKEAKLHGTQTTG